jgi:thiol-disulfide isomerase/thioredoxin
LPTTGSRLRRLRPGRRDQIAVKRAGTKRAVTTTPEHATRARPRRLAWLAAAAVAGVFAGLAGVYGIGGFMRNAGDPDCRSAVETARRVGPLARGEVAAMAIAESPLRMPDVGFHDRSGTERRLSEWHGRTVLLNLWATWCIPCRKEMPALDALEGALGGARFEVVAVNIDTRDSVKPHAWLEEVGVNRLAYYADASAKVFQDLKLIGRAFGLPTTMLVDAAGCEIGTAAGPAEWASEDGLKLVRSALGG